jgi:hypothetical protein
MKMIKKYSNFNAAEDKFQKFESDQLTFAVVYDIKDTEDAVLEGQRNTFRKKLENKGGSFSSESCCLFTISSMEIISEIINDIENIREFSDETNIGFFISQNSLYYLHWTKMQEFLKITQGK